MNEKHKPHHQSMLIKIEPTLQQVRQYIKNNPTVLHYEKNPYQADRLMMLLDNEKLAALEEEFNEHPNGIELPNFIWLMKCAIVHQPEEKYELVNGLIKLFQDIDINGDGHMEWSEFTQYIIDAVIGDGEGKQFDARFEKDREMNEVEILDRAYSRKNKKYVQSDIFDHSNHTNIIKKIKYSAQNDQVLCLEQNSYKIKYYNSECVENNFKLSPPLEDTQLFVLDFEICEPENKIALITSDRSFFFFENNLQSKVIKQYKHDVLQTGIWYLQLHKCWVTAGADFNIRVWDIRFQDKYSDNMITERILFMAHLKQITTIIELASPKLIASASLDGKIKLWDLSEKLLLTELKDPGQTNRGIRGLTYSLDYGSNLLSFGFENHINVWCPEISITRAYIGKLEGHSSLIVVCKFQPLSPNCISIDDRHNIRIWDIRTLATVQILQSDQNFSIVTDMCILPKHDKFVVTGKRLNYYHNQAAGGGSGVPGKNSKQPNEEAYPVNISFNTYYSQILVQTKIDIRIYSALTGKMKKVFNELQDEKCQAELNSLCFGGRQRKFFIADNTGLIRQYNMKNGEFLKKVNSVNEIEKSEFASKLANIKRNDNLEISQIIFLMEEKLLITASHDSTIRIYDESDPEESSLIKVLCGGNHGGEITVIAYSQFFMLLAAGSQNGIISLWDFENGKLESALFGSKHEVVAIEFIDNLPILISANSAGQVYVWGLKQSKPHQRHHLLIQVNISNHAQPNNGNNALFNLTSMIAHYEINSGLSIQYDEEIFATQPDQAKNKSEAPKKSGIDKKNTMEYHFEKSYYNSDIKIKKKRLYVYISDSKGFISVITLSEILDHIEVIEVDKIKKGISYQLKRKDLIDASKNLETLVQTIEKQIKPKIVLISGDDILIRLWQAHKLGIVKLNKIEEAKVFTSNSLDKKCKMWNYSCYQCAEINIGKPSDNFWEFPFDWVDQKLKDIELVFDALKLIEKEDLTQQEKENIKSRFLINKYFNEVHIDKIQRIAYDEYMRTQITDQNNEEKLKKKQIQGKSIKLDPEEINKQNQLKLIEQVLTLKSKLIEDQKDKAQKKAIEQTQLDKSNIPAQQQFDEIVEKCGLNPRSRSALSEQTLKLLQKMEQLSQDPQVKEEKKTMRGEKAKSQYILKQKNNLKSQNMSRKPPEFSGTLNLEQFNKNQMFVNNLVSSLKTRPNTDNKFRYVQDIKYQNGECNRVIKLATYKNSLEFESNSQKMVGIDNEALRIHKEYFRSLFDKKDPAKTSEQKQSLHNDQQNMSKTLKPVSRFKSLDMTNRTKFSFRQ